LTRVAQVEDLAAQEARLAQRTVAGDGDAFAELYGRYEKRAYNLCLRILGSEDDAADATQEAFVSVLKRLPKLEGRDLAFGSYLFTSARHACYDQIERHKRAEPSDEIPESSVPVGGGVGGGGIGFDPGDPDDDPERNVLQKARQDEIRQANALLPERQREVLALRELDDLSYDEIAEIMDMNRNSVAQLISRARINLRDALRGTALASIATSSGECQRALALIAARQDSEGDGSSWLSDHLIDCETCRLRREAMEEAGASYRGWLPVAAAPFLFRETLAQAAEAVGADWSELIARHEAASGGAGGGDAIARRRGPFRHRRLDLLLGALLVGVVLLVMLAGSTRDSSSSPDPIPVAHETAVADEPQSDSADEPGEPRIAGKKREAGGGEPTGAAAPGTMHGDDDEPAPVMGDRSAPRSQGGGSSQRRRQGGALDRRGGQDGGEGLAGNAPAAQPVDPPVETTPDPPEDTAPEPPASTGGCRDAAGIPIECPSDPPRMTCPSTGCIRIPPPTLPPPE